MRIACVHTLAFDTTCLEIKILRLCGSGLNVFDFHFGCTQSRGIQVQMVRPSSKKWQAKSKVKAA